MDLLPKDLSKIIIDYKTQMEYLMDFPKFINKVLANEQTDLVNAIHHMWYNDINNLDAVYDEDDDYKEVYRWFLINDEYNWILEHNEDIVYCEYKGQKWLGITSGNCSIKWDISVKNFINAINNKINY
jgi:hypothetical protein